MTNNDNPTISLAFSETAAMDTDDGIVQIDVLAENMPEDLFGAAFHLAVNDENFELAGYKLGDVFTGDRVFPVMLATKLDNEIVFGVTLKKGDQAEIRDGLLVTFSVIPRERETLELEFKDAVLSTFNNKREDVPNAVWVNAFYDFSDNTHDSGTETIQANSFFDGKFFGEEAGMFTVMYMSLFISFFLILTLYLGLMFYRKRRKNPLT